MIYEFRKKAPVLFGQHTGLPLNSWSALACNYWQFAFQVFKALNSIHPHSLADHGKLENRKKPPGSLYQDNYFDLSLQGHLNTILTAGN
jgi:hypothetical protein